MAKGKSNKKKPAGAPVGREYVINQIVVKAPQRKVYDVGDWRRSLLSADSGRVKAMYDLLEDVYIDGVLSDAIQKRIDAVLNSELTFQGADGSEVDVITDLMDTPAWEDLLTEIMRMRIWGRSGVEFDFTNGLSVEPIPPKHIDLKHKTILIHDSDERGIPYEGDSNLLILGKERDYGLLFKAAPYAIYKRGGFGDWAQWVELFGMPQRIGKYNTYDPESRKLLEEAFETAGSAPYVVIPKEAEVETKEAGTGSGNSYNEFRQANNEEMLITILGQTMTTVQGDKGARSLGEVHKEVEEGKNKSDLRFVQRILNMLVLPRFESRGYPVTGGKWVFPKAAEPLTVDEIIQLSEIIDIPADYVHEKYSIPVPKDGDKIAKKRTSLALEPEYDPEEEPITNADRNFFIRLWDFFVGAPQAGAFHGRNHITLSDSASLDERVITRVANSEGSDYFNPELFDFLSNEFLNAIQTGFKRSINNADLSFAYGLQDDAYITALEMNVFPFSAGKTLAEIQELNKLFRESKSFEEFHQKAKGVCETFNKTWQKTEYDTAILAAESASNYHRLKSKVDLFPYWQYVTTGDENVRDEHQKLDGIILPANDPRWDKIFPPNGWRCRCRVNPLMRYEVEGIDIAAMRAIVDKYLSSKEWKMSTAQGWGINRGKTAEVFNKNQQYIRKFPDKASKMLGNLYYNDYGLDSFAKKISKATGPAPLFTSSPKDWIASHQILVDYKGRKLQLTEKVFEKHTTKKYEASRVPLIGCIEDVLKNPDEVWLNNYQQEFKNLNFIKFYENKAIVVICEVKDGTTYQVNTWFEIEQDPNIKEHGRGSRKIDPRWRYRRGLLIKK